MILPRKQRLALKHLCENTSRTPYVNLNVILLPREHYFWSAVVARRDIASHLWVLDSGETEIADLQVTILIDQDIAWFQITMDDACRVHVFQPSLDSISFVHAAVAGWYGREFDRESTG